MANFMNELFSIILSILTKSAFIAFPILFMSSLLQKMNWVHYSSFTVTVALLVLNIGFSYGWMYIFFYIFIRGITGNYVPKCLPPFPYFMTSPQVQHINYIKSKEEGIKMLPTINNDKETYSEDNYDGNFITNLIRWVFPKLTWEDKYSAEVVYKDKILEMKNPNECGAYIGMYDLYKAK